MKRFPFILLALAAPLAAAEIQPARIPASANWVLHVDMDAMRATETGKAVLARIESEHGAKLRAAKRMFSVHPLTDLRDVTLFGDGRKDHAVVLFSGTFDRGHLTDLVKAADDYRESTHAGITIHSWKDKGAPQHAAFAADDLLVFSRFEQLLKDSLDVLKSPVPSSANAILPTTGSRPLVAAGARMKEIEMPEDSARVLKQAGLIKLSAHEDAGRFTIRMDADTDDATRATRLRRVLDGMAALAEIANPDLAAGGFQAEITSPGGQKVGAVLGMPLDAWLALMKKEAEKKAAATGKP